MGEIFMPESSLPVASVARSRPNHTSDVSASSGDLHTPSTTPLLQLLVMASHIVAAPASISADTR